MANLNPLTDLSTVDIQAIQDSGPVHPRILLPPLTTIAENWDSIESSSKNLTANNESNSEDEDDEDSDDEKMHSFPPKNPNRNSHRTSCSSSSTSDSETDSSESEPSDATSDSAESSSSSSDSDSESQSSASSVSSRSKKKIKSATAVHPNKASFSVREANYDRGRLTLRLSTLQLNKKLETNVSSVTKTSRLSQVGTNSETSQNLSESARACGPETQHQDIQKKIINKSRGNPNQVLTIFLSSHCLTPTNLFYF